MAWMRFRKREMPGNLWTKCPECEKMLFNKELDENCKVCMNCSFHFKIDASERLRYLLDEGSFEEIDAGMIAVDALQFVDDKSPYSEKLAKTREKTGRNEAMVIGLGRLRTRRIAVGTLEFNFMGGSMGVVVGEKVARITELATEQRLPLILMSASGGARMHEGTLSLMQMAKTCAALGRFHAAGCLSISVLTHPTTGGVTASWATMADVVLAEPKSLIGFAGPRVIKNTIRQELPEGFQTSEFLIERGQIDRIVPRPRLVEEIDALFTFLLGPVEEQRPTANEPAVGDIFSGLDLGDLGHVDSEPSEDRSARNEPEVGGHGGTERTVDAERSVPSVSTAEVKTAANPEPLESVEQATPVKNKAKAAG